MRYSNGVKMSYSVNAFMPIEGYRVAFNGTQGRLEVRDYERQPWKPEEETEIYLIKNFGQREKIAPTGSTEGGHGGGDTRLRDLIFRKADAPAHMRLPGSRAGAMSCLTGIAARKSIDENRPIRIADLVSHDRSTAERRPPMLTHDETDRGGARRLRHDDFKSPQSPRRHRPGHARARAEARRGARLPARMPSRGA